jgi:hypothetical protein
MTGNGPKNAALPRETVRYTQVFAGRVEEALPNAGRPDGARRPEDAPLSRQLPIEAYS